MNKEKIKSQLLNLIAVLFFCFVFCVTDGIIGFFASVFASVFLGCAITKHYYGFFVLETSMILAIITAFYTLMAGALGFAAGIKEAAMIVLLGSALGIATNVGFTVGKTILLCSAVYFADVLIGILLSQDSISYSMLLEELGTVITDSITTQYGSQPEVVAMTEELIREMIMLSYKLMPAMFIGISVLSAFILTVIYKKMLSKINKDIVPLTNIADLRGNKILGIIFLISLSNFLTSKKSVHKKCPSIRKDIFYENFPNIINTCQSHRILSSHIILMNQNMETIQNNK